MENEVILRWPESQKCIGCENGCFIDPSGPNADKIGDSAYVCFIGEPENSIGEQKLNEEGD